MQGYKGRTEWDKEIAALTKKQDPDHPLSKNEAIRLLSLTDRLIGWHDRDGEIADLKKALKAIQEWLLDNGPVVDDGITHPLFVKANNLAHAALKDTP